MSNNYKILCVDDEKDINDMLRDAFELEDFSVTCSDNAEEALTLLGSDQFDVIISDQCMPGLDGHEFLKKVKSLMPEMPLFYLCTGNRSLIKEDLSQYGLTSMVEKPYDVFDFAELINKKLTNMKSS